MHLPPAISGLGIASLDRSFLWPFSRLSSLTICCLLVLSFIQEGSNRVEVVEGKRLETIDRNSPPQCLGSSYLLLHPQRVIASSKHGLLKETSSGWLPKKSLALQQIRFYPTLS